MKLPVEKLSEAAAAPAAPSAGKKRLRRGQDDKRPKRAASGSASQKRAQVQVLGCSLAVGKNAGSRFSLPMLSPFLEIAEPQGACGGPEWQCEGVHRKIFLFAQQSFSQLVFREQAECNGLSRWWSLFDTLSRIRFSVSMKLCSAK